MISSPATTVLIVDDDEAKRHAISKILRRGGYTIREVATGLEALRAATDRPDLIVLDVKLPDLSGFEVCRRIKSDPATAAIPVLHISTTFVDIEDRVQGLEGGADGYLTDVLEPVELLATVKALLRARQAEEAAQISSRQWQFTFDAINDGVILLDRSGRIIQVNQAVEGIFAKVWGEFPGMMIQDLLGISAEEGRDQLAVTMETGRRWVVEVTQGEKGLRITIDPIRSPEGAAMGGLCIVSDFTDRRRMEDELRRRAEDLAEADRRKDEFLAMLAHELRNPLAPIRNALEILRLDRADPRELEEARAIAERQVVHMARLLDDLLDVSRFTRGHVQIVSEPVELGQVLRQAIEVSRPLIEEGGHEFATRFPDEPVWVEGDRTRLAQVVSNLLNNAAKYTDRGGHIALDAAREGDEAVIRVRDDGIGLSDEMLPRVFDLFAQDDRSLDRSRGGLGIGLTMVRSLVRLHRGSVDVKSEGLGTGAEFIVRLPVMSVSRAGPSSASSGNGPTPSRALRVLVVDDSEDSARSLARIIRHWGHETVVAHDGHTAIASAASTPFDAVVLDIGLPGMDGYQVAKALRSQQGPAQSLIIALTGYGQEEDLLRSRDAGFDHHLVKPVSLEKLKNLLGVVSGEPA